jgi:hypothetical protein
MFREASMKRRIGSLSRKAGYRMHTSSPPTTSWPGLSRPSTPTRRGFSEGWRDVDVPATATWPCHEAARPEPNPSMADVFFKIPQLLGVDKPGHDGRGASRDV